MIHQFTISTRGTGLYPCTNQIQEVVERSGVEEGLCTVFIRHTSASLAIQENADPDVCRDLDAFFRRLVPEGDPLYTQTDEGPDDMPAHVKSALTQTSIAIPVIAGRLALGTWQGVFVWEHRKAPHRREIVVHVS